MKVGFMIGMFVLLISPIASAQTLRPAPAKAEYDLTGLGRDPSGCKGLQPLPGTTPRLFDTANGKSKEGLLGRKLEQEGYVRTTGYCGSQGIVLFLFTSKLDKALDVANNFNSGQQNLQGEAVVNNDTYQSSPSNPKVLQGGATQDFEPRSGYGVGWARPDYYDSQVTNPTLRASATTRFTPHNQVQYGTLPIPGEKDPVDFTVQPVWAQLYQTPKSLGTIEPSASDGFVTATGYMAGPSNLYITYMKLKSGKVIRNQNVPLHY